MKRRLLGGYKILESITFILVASYTLLVLPVGLSSVASKKFMIIYKRQLKPFSMMERNLDQQAYRRGGNAQITMMIL
jgi:hypothetical protein